MANIAHTEGRHLRHRSRVDSESGVVQLVVKNFEVPFGMVWDEEGCDDAAADFVGDVALEAELGHAFDEDVSVVLVALQARADKC